MKLRHQGIILGEDSRKMSKSRGNVVNPDDVVTRVRRRCDAAVRDVHGAAGGDEALEHARCGRGVPVPEPRLAAVSSMMRGASIRGCTAVSRRPDLERVYPCHGQEGGRGYRGAPLQHGDRPADDLCERGDEERAPAARSCWSRSSSCSRRLHRTSRKNSGRNSDTRQVLTHEPWPSYDPAKIRQRDG